MIPTRKTSRVMHNFCEVPPDCITVKEITKEQVQQRGWYLGFQATLSDRLGQILADPTLQLLDAAFDESISTMISLEFEELRTFTKALHNYVQ